MRERGGLAVALWPVSKGPMSLAERERVRIELEPMV